MNENFDDNYYKSSNKVQQKKHVENHEIPIGDSFKLNAMKKLGSGAFGEIFLGINTKQREEVAIKLELSKTKSPQLFYESKIYKILEGGGTYLTYIYITITFISRWYS